MRSAVEEKLEAKPILKVRNLTKIYGDGCPECLNLTGPRYDTNRCPRCGSIVACGNVGFDVMPGEILGLVGESGAGKSTVVQCLYFDLHPTQGTAFLDSFGDQDILHASVQTKRTLRSFHIGMVYQNPQLGLYLDITSGGNIAEKLLAAGWRHVDKMRGRAASLLSRTEVPVDRMDEPPRNFSGGMQQRVQIAKALANSPELILLDELTTGLDVSVQAQIIDMIKEIQRSTRIAMILISHDLRIVRLLAQRTIVMKNGYIVEDGLTDQILEDPQHKYTQLLVSCIM